MENIGDKAICLVDEAHNLDDVCIESKTLRLDRFLIKKAM